MKKEMGKELRIILLAICLILLGLLVFFTYWDPPELAVAKEHAARSAEYWKKSNALQESLFRSLRLKAALQERDPRHSQYPPDPNHGKWAQCDSPVEGGNLNVCIECHKSLRKYSSGELQDGDFMKRR